ncbi:Neuroglian [Lamellibrachia satsuma]|nr:Neuroglian [Lamellibrachia satsuma]
MCVNVGVVLMLFLCCVCGQRERVVTERKVDIPPLILQHPPRIVPFVVGESIELKCVASGQPKPEYRWEMNDREFSPSGNDPRVIIQPGVGTLIFVNPILKDEGFFKCFASNRVGTAVTDVIYLRQARLDQFLAQSHPYRHSPHLGEGLKLPCIIPTSYPKAVIFWGIISQTGTYEPVVTTDRITIDPEGNLFFANIIPGDAKGGRQYACIAQNLMMRKTERGAFAFISPQGQTVLNMKPTIVWKPHTNQVAVRGETLSIKCIFSGSPTPRVDWERLEKPMSPRARIDSYGQELIIENVQFEDAGTYQCGGINTETSSAVRSSFNVEVEYARMGANCQGIPEDRQKGPQVEEQSQQQRQYDYHDR